MGAVESIPRERAEEHDGSASFRRSRLSAT